MTLPLRLRWGTLIDLAIIVGYVLAAFVVFSRLWVDLDHRFLIDGGQDQYQWEWFFAVTAKAVTHLGSPLFTTLQNYPLGVNLMANTVTLGIAIPLAWVTLFFGPTVTWAVILTAGLAATAAAWYWLLSRHIVRSRTAAGIGAGFCAFAPPLISHANAHPNLVVLFVIPLIIRQIIRLCEGRRVVRDGVVLGLLIAYQIFVGEEPLLLAATGLGIYALGYAIVWPSAARAATHPLLTGLALAAAVCLPLVAYPLTWQFFGPQSYHHLFHDQSGNDLAAFTAFGSRSLAGNWAAARSFVLNPAEENAFFGWPLLVLVASVAIWLRRIVLARAVAFVILVAALFSLGPQIMIHGKQTGIPGPWRFVSRLPLYESVFESRFTLICVPGIGILLALATGRVREIPTAEPRRAVPVQVLWYAALAGALLPIAPTPLRAVDRVPTPEFFTRGLWREYVGEGRSVVPIPLPDAIDAIALQWQVDAGLGFPLAEGYFAGPYGRERQGMYGAFPRPTSSLLRSIRYTGSVPTITPAERQAVREDLAYWRADAVVLGPHPNQAALRATLERLLGPGKLVGGVWMWDVRSITALEVAQSKSGQDQGQEKKEQRHPETLPGN